MTARHPDAFGVSTGKPMLPDVTPEPPREINNHPGPDLDKPEREAEAG